LLATGDLAVLLQRKTHWLQNDQRKTVTKSEDACTRTTIVRGRFTWDENRLASLMPELPPIIHFENQDGCPVSWMTRIIQMLKDKSALTGLGARTVVDHLAYVILVQSVLAHFADSPRTR
jgi:hypothetical protein